MLKSLSHISLALIFLISTVGLTINIHYCQGEIYDVGFFSQADDCCNDATHHHNHCCQKKEDKCKDDTIQLKVQDNFTASNINIEFNNYNIINVFINNIELFDFIDTHKENINPLYISPPVHTTSISFLQSYLL